MTEIKKNTKPPQLEDIPDLLVTIQNEKGEKSAAAIKRSIYELWTQAEPRPYSLLWKVGRTNPSCHVPPKNLAMDVTWLASL